MRLFLVFLFLFTVINAAPIEPPDQSPVPDIGNAIFSKRERDCSARPCANPQGQWVIYRAECVQSGCGLCSARGYCLPPPHDRDHYDPNNPTNPFGGSGGAASNGEGSDDSSNTCHDGDVQDDAGSSCPINGKYAGTAGRRPAAPSTRKQKASCSGSCSWTAHDESCGSGCGCNFAGTGLFGGPDGRCVALASFAG